MRRVRWLVAAPLAFATFAAACGGGRSESDTSVAGGDAGRIEVEALRYEVTPDRYDQWVAAQRALDAIAGLSEPPSLDASRVTDADIDRAARYLESNPRARAALARAGLSARDYVMTSVALDQALVATTAGSGSGSSADERARISGASSPDRSGSGARAAAGASGGTPSATTTRRRTRTVYRNVPPRNVEIVEEKREEIARVRSGMRFRIVKERPDTVVVESIGPAPSHVLAAGTTLALRSDSRVCSSSHKAGDRITGTVTTAVTDGGTVVIPAGAQASLSVVGSPRAGAPLELTLNSISFNGQTHAAAGSAVASKVERVRVGSASKDAQKVVGGAAVGAVAGQVLGRDTKSTVIGAAVGAAAGAAAASASARSDNCLAAGAPIQATLRDALTMRT